MHSTWEGLQDRMAAVHRRIRRRWAEALMLAGDDSFYLPPSTDNPDFRRTVPLAGRARGADSSSTTKATR